MYPNTGNSNRSILLGMVSILDEVIGNMTQALEKNGLLDDTLIFFTSDVITLKMLFETFF